MNSNMQEKKFDLSKGSEQPGFMGLGAYEADVYRDAIKTASSNYP